MSQSSTRVSSRSRARRALAAFCALAAAAGLAACGPQGPGVRVTSSSKPSVSTAPVPQDLETFYDQDLSWYPCDEGDDVDPLASGAKADFECATIKVPLDYEDPQGQTIDLALKRLRAKREPLGTLFINPGGPGGSGVKMVDTITSQFPSELLGAYDIVGFDPRGVGASTPVDCLTDEEMDAERNAPDDTASTTPEQDQEALTQDVTEFEAKCEQNSPEGLLDHIDTVSAARDLDVMRALVGDSALTYVGYSYGTYLGATYAELFPSNVGRMVLDGAVDPTLSSASLSEGQAKGFEAALRAYVEDCQSGKDCPLSGDVDQGVKQVQDFFESLKSNPLPTADPNRKLTASLARSTVITFLYVSEYWDLLTEALAQAMHEQDGSQMLYYNDQFAERSEDGSYEGNGDEVISAINCLDYPVQGDPATWTEQASKLKEVSPTFGESLAYQDLYCQVWGHSSSRAHDSIKAQGAAPILVIGTTGDPATPYEWSQALAEQLDSGQLLTWEGNGHTAFGRSGPCVTNPVTEYLLNGTMPKEGLTCKGEE